MPTAAIAAYGTQLRLGDGVTTAPLAVTFIANTSPITVAVSPNHGIPIGEVTWVTVSGTGVGVGADGSWVAEAVNVTTLELRGSVWGGTSWVSGGTVTPRSTFTHIAELVNITPIGISFNMVDASSHDGDGWGSSIPTLKRGVDARVEVNLVPSDPTHDELTGLMYLALNKIRRPWLIVLPDVGKTTVAFEARVTDHGTVTPIEGVLRSAPVLSIDGAMSWTY